MNLPDFIIPILYILVGAVIGLGFDWLKIFLKNKEINKSVRTLINLEIDKNKTLLKDYWETVSSHESYWFEHNEFKYMTLANVINDVPLPLLGKIAWDKNFNFLPKVYKSKRLKDIWSFYENLELLIQLKEHLFFIENENENIVKVENQFKKDIAQIINDVIKVSYFNKDAQSLAQKFKETIEKIIGSNTVLFINKNL